MRNVLGADMGVLFVFVTGEILGLGRDLGEVMLRVRCCSMSKASLPVGMRFSRGGTSFTWSFFFQPCCPAIRSWFDVRPILRNDEFLRILAFHGSVLGDVQWFRGYIVDPLIDALLHDVRPGICEASNLHREPHWNAIALSCTYIL
jgi:hypothetical protein